MLDIFSCSFFSLILLMWSVWRPLANYFRYTLTNSYYIKSRQIELPSEKQCTKFFPPTSKVQMLLPAIPTLSVCCVAWFLQFTGTRHCFNWPKYYKNITKYFPSHFMFANIQQLVIWKQQHSSSANTIVKTQN